MLAPAPQDTTPITQPGVTIPSYLAATPTSAPRAMPTTRDIQECCKPLTNCCSCFGECLSWVCCGSCLILKGLLSR